MVAWPTRHGAAQARGLHQHPRATSSVVGYRVARYRPLQDKDIVVHDGLRTTGPDLTVLDAALDLGMSVIDSASCPGASPPSRLRQRMPGTHDAAARHKWRSICGWSATVHDPRPNDSR